MSDAHIVASHWKQPASAASGISAVEMASQTWTAGPSMTEPESSPEAGVHLRHPSRVVGPRGSRAGAAGHGSRSAHREARKPPKLISHQQYPPSPYPTSAVTWGPRQRSALLHDIARVSVVGVNRESSLRRHEGQGGDPRNGSLTLASWRLARIPTLSFSGLLLGQVPMDSLAKGAASREVVPDGHAHLVARRGLSHGDRHRAAVGCRRSCR